MTAMSRQGCRARVEGIVAAGTRALSEFDDLLSAEREALETRDWQALEQTAAGKERCLDTLEALEASRRACLADGGFEAHAMDECLSWCDPAGELEPRWQRYRALADDCGRANRTNGAIVHARRLHLDAALAALSGDTASAPTYGRAGAERSPNGGRTLGEA